MYSVLIVEDDVSIRQLIKYDLEQANFDVDTASDGYEGFKMVYEKEYDIVILDLMMPRINGIDFCKRVRKEGFDFYVIMLTAMDEETTKLSGFESGADDYITKPFTPSLLMARINAGLRRLPKSDERNHFGNIEIHPESLTISCSDETVHLTVKEFELMVYLIKNTGKLISRNQLLQDLWGFAYDGDTRIIDVHISRLRHCLKGSNVRIVTKRGVGYKIEVLHSA